MDHNRAHQIPNLAEMLVEDRELGRADADRFRHTDLVSQLADLATQASTPANIALYGPWGSGKSSIAALLGAELKSRNSPVRFARYDAFKYAKLPLQRHFIQHLANQLEVTDRKYGRGLYEDTVQSDVVLGSPRDGETGKLVALTLQMILVLAVALAAATILTTGAAAVAAWIDDTKGFRTTYADYLRNNTLGFLAPAGILAVFGTLAGKKLSVTRGDSAPTSDEQLAHVFSELVGDALKNRIGKQRCDRLVVFIDELDRCDGDTVVETLASLRSFLDADRCVFVVAADQQVLETALTAHLSQATPHDNTNPYYSAGSEYLDKTFHYQLSIPPLLPRRLSGFAAELVRGRPGPWAEVDSVERVVSVLIPNHVRSPRRTKTLLNAFALQFELAERRCEAGHLAGAAAARAEEIAVLVCLRVEFPLFARELRQHPKLIEAARSVLENGGHERPAGVSDSTWEIAQDFCHGSRASDVYLVADGSERSANADVEDDESPEVATHESDAPLRVAQAHQLQAYLRKTAFVSAPGRDLIHLESTGARFGLDPLDAEELEDSASQADLPAVEAVLERLGDQGTSGLLSLAESLDREVPPLGLEADNLVSVLLRLFGGLRAATTWSNSSDAAAITERFSTAIDAHARTYELREADLAGALALGLDSETPSGKRLIYTVLTHPMAAGRKDVALTAIDAMGILAADHTGEIAEIVLATLTKDPLVGETCNAILRLPSDEAATLWGALAPQLTAHLRALLETDEPTAEGEEGSETSEVDVALEAFETLARELLEALSAELHSLEFAADCVLRVDRAEARNVVSAYLSRLCDSGRIVEHEGLSASLLEASTRRSRPSVPAWLAGVNPTHVSRETLSRTSDRVLSSAWKSLEKDADPEEDPDHELAGICEALHRLLPTPLGSDSEVAAEIGSTLVGPANDADVGLSLVRLRRLGALIVASTLANSTAGALAVDPAIRVLESAVAPPDDPHKPLVDWLAQACRIAGAYSDEEGAMRSMAAVASCSWISDEGRAKCDLVLVGLGCSRDLDLVSAYSASEIAELVDQFAPSLDDDAARWLAAAVPEPTDGQPVVSALFERRPSSEARSLISQYSGAIEPHDALELVRPEVYRCLTDDPRLDLLRAVNIGALDDDGLADVIASTFDRATNMDHRKRLIDVWQVAGIELTSARAQLISAVLLPTAQAGSSGLDYVVKHTELWRDPPHGTRQLLRDLKTGTTGAQRRKVEEALVTAGLAKKQDTFFGLGPSTIKDID